jgi:hypothetical protein
MATLNSFHRCDRCGAQAYTVVTLTNGGMLMFCAHHYAKHKHVLSKVAVHIIDETTTLRESIVDDKHAVG